MAKAKSTQPIPPFPSNIDRDAFGHWLSGFTDGEGCFMLRVFRTMPNRRHHKIHPQRYANFHITLRDDDAGVLRLIHSYFGCGILVFSDNTRCGVPNAKPVARLLIQDCLNLESAVVPHFEKFPLRAKKKSDFEIWRQGVKLLAAIRRKPRIGKTGGSGGIQTKWLQSEIDHFAYLAAELSNQRRYPHCQLPVEPMPEIQVVKNLFD